VSGGDTDDETHKANTDAAGADFKSDAAQIQSQREKYCNGSSE